MLFNTAERLKLYSILPRQGDVLSLRTIKTLQEAFGFSDEERTTLELNAKEDGSVWWNPKKDFQKEILLNPFDLKIICDALAELDRKKILGLDFLELYDKIMQEKKSRDNEKK